MQLTAVWLGRTAWCFWWHEHHCAVIDAVDQSSYVFDCPPGAESRGWGGQSTNAACSLVLSSSFGVLAAWCSWCHEQSRSFMGAASECCPGQLPNTLRSCTLAHYLLEAVVQKIQLNLLAHYKCCAEIISKLYAVCISHPYQDIFLAQTFLLIATKYELLVFCHSISIDTLYKVCISIFPNVCVYVQMPPWLPQW